MATDYDYTRALKANGKWDINNPSRLGGDGQPIPLAKEIEAALPGKTFFVNCDGTLCRITFDIALTAGEKTTLDGVVAAHKSASGPEPQADETFFDPHVETHEKDGNDELLIQNMGSGSEAANKIPVTDGSGGLWLQTKPSGYEEFHFGSEDREQRTTNTGYQKSFDLTIDLDGGDYLVVWSAELANSGGWSRYTQALVFVEPTGPGASQELAQVSSEQNYSRGFGAVAGIAKVTLNKEQYMFSIAWRRQGYFSTAYIRNARIAVWRV